jgi:hypothetical protein
MTKLIFQALSETSLLTSQQESLLALLLCFEELFDGTLSDWKLLPVFFELKEGAKPFDSRPYPILKTTRLLS